MTEKVETRGRKKTSEIDKARSRASRDHKLYQETLTEEFEQLQRDRELQFAYSFSSKASATKASPKVKSAPLPWQFISATWTWMNGTI